MDLMNIELLVQEFYAIEALLAISSNKQYGNFQPFRHSHHRWSRDFEGFRDAFISKLASAIYDYTVLAVAAELRHCRKKSSYYIKDYYTESIYRDEVYDDCAVYDPCSILTAGLKMFDISWNDWAQSFGGAKWRQIAKAGLMKGKAVDCIFIDHCVDLSHNSSAYFDKGAGIFCLENSRRYKEFLDVKRCCEPHQLLKSEQGYMFRQLLQRAVNLGIIRDCALAAPSPDRDTAEALLLNYHPIQWGRLRLDCSAPMVLYSNRFYSGGRREDHSEYRRTYADAA